MLIVISALLHTFLTDSVTNAYSVSALLQTFLTDSVTNAYSVSALLQTFLADSVTNAYSHCTITANKCTVTLLCKKSPTTLYIFLWATLWCTIMNGNIYVVVREFVYIRVCGSKIACVYVPSGHCCQRLCVYVCLFVGDRMARDSLNN